MRKTFVKSTGWRLLLIGWLLLLPGNVAANVGPSPSKLWFTFDYAITPQAKIEAVQLLGCTTAGCDMPTLLLQYGQCTASACLATAPTLTGRSTLECADNRCLATLQPFSLDIAYPTFKLLAQFSDGVRTGSFIAGPLQEWGDDRAWVVQVETTDLILVKDAEFVDPTGRYDGFFWRLALTLAVELLIAGALLWWGKKAERDVFVKRMVMVGLINLLTYPLVWLVFPSLGQFQRDYLRTMSLFVTIAFVLYAAALVWIYLPKDKSMRRLALIMTLLSLPVTGLCLLFVLIVNGYGNYAVAVQGLTPGTAILLTEVFVVLAEGLLLWVLSRKSLPLLHAGAISLLMNLGSFLVGQMIL
ncbi:MAG: hypothetical protein JXR84_11100 [Anaerolineae bacterium]|nr:hypothetical protein [Anaerolineae bacterium]